MNAHTTITLEQVKKLKPCEDRWAFVSKALPAYTEITAHQARDAGCTFDDMVWLASALARSDNAIERRLRHWMADCATRVLYLYERDYPNDMRVRDAITAVREFADGRIGSAARSAARSAAGSAARSAARSAAGDAAWSAAWSADWDSAWSAAGDAARSAARSAAGDAVGDAAWAAAGNAAGAADWDSENDWQFNRLIAWLSSDEPAAMSIPARVDEVAA